jgi:hypothetical protein
MDTVLMEALARLAGLDKMLAGYPDDLAAAFASATGHREVIKAPEAPDAEPWPPMRAGEAL